MNHASSRRAVSSPSPIVTPTHLHGYWLLLARMLWVAVFVLTLVIFCANLLVGHYGLARTIMLVVVTTVWFIVSLMLFWRKSTDRAALPFSLMLVLLGGVVFPPPAVALATYGAWWIPIDLVEALAAVLLISVYTFPNGRFVPGLTRWLALVWIAFSLLPIPILGAAYLRSWWLAPPYILGRTTFYCSLVPSLLYRYRRISTQLERQQIKWVIFAGAIAIGSVNMENLSLNVLPAYFPSLAVSDQPHQLISALSVNFIPVLIPISIGIAILRYRLWDIDIIINRTLVYGTLTVSIISLYVLLVTALGAVLRAQGNLLISLFATGLIAVLFQPLREVLQRGVNRLLYGQRDEPYTVITHLSQRLKGTLEPEAVLSTIVETVAQALRLPYAAILWKQEETFELAASYGRPAGELVTLPLVYQAETIGQLQLASRAPGEAFTPADMRLLDELARQAGLAAHAVRLATDLQKARERLVLAREEERRHLRRNLHDGVGPTLASLSQRIDIACHLVKSDPDATIMQLRNLKAQIKSTIGDIRRVVYALRPPVLDELGLVSAIREHVMQQQEMNSLHISVEAPADVPPLPAAVEVAAYRITLEALTNVERHAHARRCLVRLELAYERSLCLSIIDDGQGLSNDYRAGVGITSMRERAAELGGEFALRAKPGGGTHVQVRLPLKS